MSDLVYLAVLGGFVLMATWTVTFCDRLVRDPASSDGGARPAAEGTEAR